ncbi:hypothetical protein [Bacillus gaemokensis]|uniref:Uncharacterized protein n=1 Tax=Bacillus gaemokensis TaxID=574375 RepID=A0A073KAL4_9BACI|nr:hypothetical protein [Bacillus gaemokensis]KEK23472.1 hypothetical protein BAGA_08205 [Bacillus gaemokensis]KYG27159.1 hypothetical protein AZF08_15505 [Bacillus gaemokensis]
MKRIPFVRPTDHYDKRLFKIDEHICELLRKRKGISNDDPGFPLDEHINNWAIKYGFYEEFLNCVFELLRNESDFRPFVEPNGFRRYIPVLKCVEKDKYLYSVTFIRQYENASVINFNIDWDAVNDLPGEQSKHHFFELFLGEKYDCRMIDGGGSAGHLSYNFIVSPPLPDDTSGINLIFREFSEPFTDKLTGFEINIHLD